MKRLACVILVPLALIHPARAHRIDEYLQATILSLHSDHLQASMRLIPGTIVAPALISAIDRNGDGKFSAEEERDYAQQVLNDLSLTLNGAHMQPQLVEYDFPQLQQMREGLGEIHIVYSVPLTSTPGSRSFVLGSRHHPASSVYLVNTELPSEPGLRIDAQTRSQDQSRYQLDFQVLDNAGAAPHGTLSIDPLQLQLGSFFRLGIRHIAEGTDHLLFLLALLLPAPLLAVAGRWAGPATLRQALLRILGVVTAFTIGHSITLTLAAIGTVRVASRPVEILIAVSILISALHAMRPLFPGREAWVAGLFGLVHGLAFAATLERLDLGRWQKILGIFSFNLGIETMQMIVVAAILPSLLILSRTRFYSAFRLTGAVFACLASIAWIAERMLNLQTPVDLVVNGIARHALLLAVMLLILSLLARLAGRLRHSPGSRRSLPAQ